MLSAGANMRTVSSNELIDGVSEEKSMIDIILQSGQAIGGSRRPWLQRGSQRGPTFDSKYSECCQNLILSSVNHVDQLAEAGFEVANE